MVIRKLTALILILLFLTGRDLAAQSHTAYIDIQPRYGDLNDEFTFSIAVEGASQIGTPYLVGGDEFNVNFTGTSQKLSSNNQGISQITIFNYILTPKKEGLLNSPAVEIEINGQLEKLKAIQIKISKSKEIDPQNIKDQPIFLNQHISSESVYIGEQILHTMELYTRIQIHDLEAQSEPFEGFWSERLGEPKQGRVQLNGTPMHVVRWLTSLFPLREGELTIAPRNVTVKIRTRKKNRGFSLGPLGEEEIMNDIMGFGTLSQEKLTSNIKTIIVKPLPTAPKDTPLWDEINIVVGKTTIDIENSSDALQVGESRTITVQLKSDGNLSPINQIPLSTTSDFRVYHEAAKEDRQIIDNKLQTTKIFRFSIVPLRSGEISIGKVSFGYFDPEEQIFKVAESAPITLKVIGESLNHPPAEIPTVTNDITTPQSNSKPIVDPQINSSQPIYLEESTLSKFSKSISLSLALLILSIILLIILITQFIRHLAKERQPQKIALKRISESNDLLQLRKTVIEFLRSKFNLRSGEISNDEIIFLIESKLTNPSIKFQIEAIFDEFDRLIYSKGAESDIETFNTIQKQALTVVKSLI